MQLSTFYKSIIPLFLLGIFVISENPAFGQTTEKDEPSTSSSFVNKTIIQPYVGAPNMKRWLYEVESDINKSSKGFGHVGLVAEFQASKRFGIGIDAIYSPFSRTETTYMNMYDPNTGQNVEVAEKLVFTENKLRIIAKAFIHFNIKNPTWDLYLAGGIGANIIFTEARLDGKKVNYNEYFTTNDVFPILNPPFPLSGRIGFGTRYYFNEYIGVNLEAGFGGPPIAVGVNFRF